MSDFKREDWTKFRSLGELPRAAGVPIAELRKLVAKELVDNALDAAGACRIGLLDDGGLWVEDEGAGIPGTADEIADLFSISRPQRSSKLLRLPLRGALGNGLRVVAGYVLAMGGTMKVFTSGMALDLLPQDDGGTLVSHLGSYSGGGTRVEVRLGNGERFGFGDLDWAERAQAMAGAATYTGVTSPYWFDEDAFWELCQASRSGTARDLVALLDGCKNPKAGIIAAPWKGRPASSLSREEAGQLLAAARNEAKPCKAERLGFIGQGHFDQHGYGRETGVHSPASAGGTLRAQLPFVVEVWARVGDQDSVEINVNRTPVTAAVKCWRQKERTELAISACALNHFFSVGQKPVVLVLNIQTPYMPITSDGKAPDLNPMFAAIHDAVKKATNSAKRLHAQASPSGRRRPETEIVRACLTEATEKASGGGENRFSLRQLYYQVRPFIITELGKEPKYDNFAKIITDIEAETGADIPGIYRDTRGVLYHPHTGQEMTLGSLNVEGYERPEWTFNKILYCEKEGFFQLLKDTKWPERHDCALLTSKGQPTRAARDIIDLMGKGDEELTFFCIHDADAAGTVILQSLQGATKARQARVVNIINLGLEPDEALNMGLAPESVEAPKKGGRPVADYVEPKWRDWLQTQRVELNAMTSPQFIAWLDRKMAEHNGGKLVPPQEVMAKQLESSTRQKVQEVIRDEVLAAANIDERADRAILSLNGEFSTAVAGLDTHTRSALEMEPALQWLAPVNEVAHILASKAVVKAGSKL